MHSPNSRIPGRPLLFAHYDGDGSDTEDSKSYKGTVSRIEDRAATLMAKELGAEFAITCLRFIRYHNAFINLKEPIQNFQIDIDATVKRLEAQDHKDWVESFVVFVKFCVAQPDHTGCDYYTYRETSKSLMHHAAQSLINHFNNMVDTAKEQTRTSVREDFDIIRNIALELDKQKTNTPHKL